VERKPSEGHSVAVVAFTTADDAQEALTAVRELGPRQRTGVRDAAVVVRTSTGHVELHQTADVSSGEGAVGGGAAGLVAGLLLGVPVAGALLGIVVGGVWGLRDTGIPDRRLRELGRDLQPGHAVLCVLVETAQLPEVRDALAGYGEVLETAVEPTDP
jgi:uncharacterized membrane protein